MKALGAAFVAVSLSVLCAGQVSARGMRGSGQSGRAGLSHSSGRPAHSGGLPAHFGRSGVHLKSGGHPFRRDRFGHHRHFEHKRFFLRHHHIGRHGFFLHHPFGFRSRFFGQYIIGVAPSSAIIWPYPEVPGLTIPGEVSRWHVRDPHGERPLITLMLRHGAELGLSPDQLQSLEELRADFQREAVRHEADIRIAETELATMLQIKPADLEQVKTKLQEIERSRLDLRFARIRTIEQGKALLSPEQWAKFQILLGEPSYSHLETELQERRGEQP
jgi:Spy/CpxP family protein refolding chaperone